MVQHSYPWARRRWSPPSSPDAFRATLAAYRADLADFAAFLGAASPQEAPALLLGRGHGTANVLAAATVNRRLAALRSLIALARTAGLVPWRLEVSGLKAQPYRDTRGPGRPGVDAGTLSILGKGRAGRETLTLPEKTAGTLAAWLAVRGEQAGALFTPLTVRGGGHG